MDNFGAFVAGTGMMGTLHSRVYSELGLLAGVFDVNTNVALNVSKKFNTRFFKTMDEMMEFANNNYKSFATTIATPTPTHLNITKFCMENGSNVFLEKPLALSLNEARNILEIEKRTSKKLAVGYIEMFNPSVIAIQEAVKTGFFGEITSINIKRIGGIPRSADNVILDLMTHDLCFLLDVTKKMPEKISSYKRKSPDGIIDSAQTLLCFDGISATCESNWISPVKKREVFITGTRGCCGADLIKQEVSFTSKENSISPNVIKKEPLKEELINFINYVKTGTGKYISAEKAFDTLKLTFDVMES